MDGAPSPTVSYRIGRGSQWAGGVWDDAMMSKQRKNANLDKIFFGVS
jgi:hypothetical protein